MNTKTIAEMKKLTGTRFQLEEVGNQFKATFWVREEVFIGYDEDLDKAVDLAFIKAFQGRLARIFPFTKPSD